MSVATALGWVNERGDGSDLTIGQIWKVVWVAPQNDPQSVLSRLLTEPRRTLTSQSIAWAYNVRPHRSRCVTRNLFEYHRAPLSTQSSARSSAGPSWRGWALLGVDVTGLTEQCTRLCLTERIVSTGAAALQPTVATTPPAAAPIQPTSAATLVPVPEGGGASCSLPGRSGAEAWMLAYCS